ncbi:MAG: AsnC family transcriptional regulator [Euryarchaeota archaeon CG01_land_8_20_14_3_00_38_12]|nr:MAG: AsnC family transcriptional regulator [Euryarchaeota archaeon CG01_land_8_20_14_3_00_38_12]
MEKAYVLLRIKRGKTVDVKNDLSQIKGVAEVNLVSGRYDAVVRIECEKLSTITDIVMNRIHKTEGIERSETLIVFA